MSHPDPNHDPENVKPFDILESDVLKAYENDDITFDEDDYDQRDKVSQIEDKEESYVSMLERILPKR